MRIDKLSSERLEVLRFPLIVGVVLIHACGTQVGLANGAVGLNTLSYLSDFVQNLISKGIAQTSVPLFFLMSGYFLFLGFSWSVKNYKEKIKSRIRTLLVPFLFWNFSTLLMFALAQYFPVNQVYLSGQNAPISTFGVYDYVNAIFGIDGPPISYQFWYIRDLMVMVLLTPAIYLVIKLMPKILFVGVLVLWFLDIWPVYVPSVGAFPFFYAGAYFACSNTSLFVLDRFGVAILFSYLPILLTDTLTKGYGFNNYIHNSGVLLGVASALFLSKNIVKLDNAKRALLWAGNCSFFVFAVHEPMLLIIRKFTYKVAASSSGMMVLTLYFSISALVILLSILLHVSMKSIAPKLLSVISGGRSQSRFGIRSYYEDSNKSLAPEAIAASPARLS
jgi:fucose 4-O-acetylase-like acetyltransferase